MSENKAKYENITKIGKLINDNALNSLLKEVHTAEKNVSSILKSISDKEREIDAFHAAEKAKASEPQETKKAVSPSKGETDSVSATIVETEKTVSRAPAAETEKPKAKPAQDISEKEKPAAAETEKPVREDRDNSPKAEPAQKETVTAKNEETVSVKQEKEKTQTGESQNNTRPQSDRPYTPREGQRPYTPREGQSDRPYTPREGQRPYTPREGQSDRPYTPRPYTPREGQNDRPYTPRDGQTQRPYTPREGQSDRPYTPRPYTPREGQSDRPYTPRDGQRPYTPREGQSDRPYTPRDGQSPRPPYTPRDGQSPRPYTPREGQSDRPYTPRPYTPREGQSDRPYTPRPYTPREGQSDRPYTPRPYTPGQSDRPYTPRDSQGRPTYTPRDGQSPRPYTPRDGQSPRPYTPRDGQSPRPYTPRDGQSPRPYNGGTYKPKDKAAAPAIIAPKDTKSFGNKKKSTDKNYDDKKTTISKRALIKSQISVEDFDEDKSGYRKLRVKKQKEQKQNFIKIEKAVINTDIIPLKTLSEKIGISAVEITKRLFKENIFKTINDTVDFDTAAFLAADLGIELELKMEKTAEEVLTESHDTADEMGSLKQRAPIVTVMGHVDHGKTSLLDKIRNTNVTSGEAGGITQHIGAYSVNIKGKTITFIDTPGHAAFTSMRARGAQVTDIAIIVVAADDGIMPQTIEAINHAKAANVSIMVAVNKIDKPTADVNKIKQQLTENGLVPEEWGGDVIMCPISAMTGEGIENLLENIILLAELKELKANPDKKARGVIIEAQLDKGKGPVASVLIQSGTLRTGDSILSGTTMGRVRAMIDDKGRTVKAAGPSMAVSILGLEDVPLAGDTIVAVEEEKLIKSVAAERKNRERESMIKIQQKITLDEVFGKIAEGNIKDLNIILKADVQGSVEAVKQSLGKLSKEEVRVNIIHSAAGAINESDIMLADSSNAIIIGFNVRADAKSKTLAERSGVDVRTYRIIYELIDDIEKALKGMLAPKFREIQTGKCEVRETFKITDVGTIAGCYVTSGKLIRNGKLRIYREDIMIIEGNVKQLKRFKDDVKEVATGYECGVCIENFNEIKIGDIIECYIQEQIIV